MKVILLHIIEYLNKRNYIFDKTSIVNNSNIYIEKEIDGKLLSIDLRKDLIKIQFNLIENYFFEDIEEIFTSFFEGKYVIKYYYSKEKIIFSKLKWLKKSSILQQNNIKTKYKLFDCSSVNKIEKDIGIDWMQKDNSIS
ncbi:hypothetical protein IQ37_12625 [Chryseobacterium piperi]|uniref:Uncharacterized protein n=1 Tax=Chryseobacterium piperi TaxID=558152 RepID=A0A086B8I2_9FLAO|nr:hypothetical protein [Chryseobacterium piperi]ASW74899.1 hypothetical protein CJF12_11815 [Chryseobacterium piperi]KFF25246.1 hypothetical protein IQ37_12625 [Chryseobacterium piperi]